MAAWQFGTLAMFGYDVIVADPPWVFENYSDAGTKKGADPHYSVMPLDAIKALPMHELARGDGLLLQWTTGWAIATGQAQEVARAWGFKPISEIVWLKRYPSGKARIGTISRADQSGALAREKSRGTRAAPGLPTRLAWPC
jgi:N6-adenosine-specific RNA methylase IME4